MADEDRALSYLKKFGVVIIFYQSLCSFPIDWVNASTDSLEGGARIARVVGHFLAVLCVLAIFGRTVYLLLR